MAYFTSQQFNYPTNQLKCGEMSELAEGARLEIVCAAKSGTEGSNPSLSAKILGQKCICKPKRNCLHVLSCAGSKVSPPSL